MKPAPFEYRRAARADEAIEWLAAGTGYAKLIAGGQTLGPMLNLRLVQPDLVIDISRIESLSRVSEDAHAVRLGAGVRHAAIEDGAVPDPARGLLARTAAGIAYRAVRNRGTLGGSLAHADPAAEWPSVMVALDARIMLRGPQAAREVRVEEFLTDPLTTDLAEAELIETVCVPRLSGSARWGFRKLCRKVGEFAQSIAVVIVDPRRGVHRAVAGASVPRALPEVGELLARAGAWREALAEPIHEAFGRDTATLDLDQFERHLHATTLVRAVREALA